MPSNYPPGVTGNEDYFYPPTCPNCGEEAVPGTECESCDEYVKTPEDYEDEAADMKYDQMKDEGLI